ncbi:GmrSD restriction endonuclease domain-containing protein [Paraburkholderia sp. RL17-337-BIB-A]|uniref:GmrSD restriction endonuclease domain-containing protein n=1 Tax=Paraburkholderia sp. RL17-337-BIB-A TaxID=3031636 RepID=UPI0038BD3882
MNDLNNAISFVDLIRICSKIEIPQIQRDYAQGRDTENEVRREFLGTLHGALQPGEANVGRPVNLDFIYGSMEGGDAGSYFLPLDGQQRLTTLFLLHWYLGWRDAQLRDFQSRLRDGRHSRFGYKVRPSSAEFFDNLVAYVPGASSTDVASVRKLIEDQSWFFLNWRLDPTIQSALTMLDAIHERFKGSEGFYARLTDDERPAITFRLLQLENFGLSDDLYIKMNARGKPLTAFETFKARFEEDLKSLFPDEQRQLGGKSWSVRDFFALRMDTQWTDLFWNYRTSASKVFDTEAMNLFWTLARISLDPQSASFLNDTFLLQSRRGAITYSALRDGGWLTRDFAENWMALLETWSGGVGKLRAQQGNHRYFDEDAIFQKIIKSATALNYAETLQLTAFVLYLRMWGNEGRPELLQDWMRVVSNLAWNTSYDHMEVFQRCMAGLRKLLPESQRILSHLAEMEAVPLGFSPQQVQEEVLKARLLLADPRWRAQIELAEEHGYFQGQVDFLLDFAGVRQRVEESPVSQWSEQAHADRLALFASYLVKAESTFDEAGLVEPNGASSRSYLWQRALLSVGDYLMPLSSNHSFGVNVADEGDSWKRFLRGGGIEATKRRTYLKTLWDRIDVSAPISAQLQIIIDETRNLEPWRQGFVGYPRAIDYCEQRKIRRSQEGQIYLLKRTKMNGTHAEFFTFMLFEDLKTALMRDKLAPIVLDSYRAVSESLLEPRVLLYVVVEEVRTGISIERDNGRFTIRVQRSPLAQRPAIEEKLKLQMHFEARAEELMVHCGADSVTDIMSQLSQIFRLA